MKVDGAGIISSWSDGTEISLYDLLKLMITESDNNATNIIIDRFDMDEINNFIQQRGYKDTKLSRKMMDV